MGHTVNMYRAALIAIDRYLLGRTFQDAVPCDEIIAYVTSYQSHTDFHRLGKEIVMSMPSLASSGGLFLLYPAMKASKVLAREDKLYIISVLNRLSGEVPVASSLAAHVREYEMVVPTFGHCTPLVNFLGR
jgi:hypothetical protein